MIERRSRGLSLCVGVLLIVVLIAPAPARATPGSTHGNYFWYKPGSTAISGQLRNYTGYVLAGTVTAGSGGPRTGTTRALRTRDVFRTDGTAPITTIT